MRNVKHARYEAVTFHGPDPASSRFSRTYTASLTDAKAFAESGTFGYVSDTKTEETVYRTPK